MKRLISILVCVCMVLVACISARAGSGTYYVKPNQYWSVCVSANHNTNYSKCGARVLSVYPTDNSLDTFRYVQCRIVDSDDVNMLNSSYVLLDELNSSVTPLQIKDGMLNNPIVSFWLRGNSNSAAYAHLNYYGTYVSGSNYY